MRAEIALYTGTGHRGRGRVLHNAFQLQVRRKELVFCRRYVITGYHFFVVCIVSDVASIVLRGFWK